MKLSKKELEGKLKKDLKHIAENLGYTVKSSASKQDLIEILDNEFNGMSTSIDKQFEEMNKDDSGIDKTLYDSIEVIEPETEQGEPAKVTPESIEEMLDNEEPEELEELEELEEPEELEELEEPEELEELEELEEPEYLDDEEELELPDMEVIESMISEAYPEGLEGFANLILGLPFLRYKPVKFKSMQKKALTKLFKNYLETQRGKVKLTPETALLGGSMAISFAAIMQSGLEKKEPKKKGNKSVELDFNKIKSENKKDDLVNEVIKLRKELEK